MRVLREYKLPLRTAVAATASLVTYQALHLRHGYWAVISAIIVMQANLGRSIQAGANRLIGTAIGAAVGAALYSAAGRNPLALLAGVAITLWLCLLTGLEDSMRLAGLTVAIVMLLGEGSAWQAGVSRFIDVSLGIVIALLVSVLWPSRARDDLRRALARTYDELHTLFVLVASCCLGQDCDAGTMEDARKRTISNSARNRELLADVEREPGASDPVLLRLRHSSERVRQHIFGIDAAGRAMAQDRFYRRLEPELRMLLNEIAATLEFLAAELRNRQPGQPPALEAALDRLQREFELVRRTGTSLKYDADELLRFYSLYYRLRQLVSELLHSAGAGELQERAA